MSEFDLAKWLLLCFLKLQSSNDPPVEIFTRWPDDFFGLIIGLGLLNMVLAYPSECLIILCSYLFHKWQWVIRHLFWLGLTNGSPNSKKGHFIWYGLSFGKHRCFPCTHRKLNQTFNWSSWAYPPALLYHHYSSLVNWNRWNLFGLMFVYKSTCS